LTHSEANGVGNLNEETGPKHTPNPAVLDALKDAFYACFKTVAPTYKRLLIAIDLSEPMTCGGVVGSSHITPSEAAASAALILLSRENADGCQIVGVSDNDVHPLLEIDRNSTLKDINASLTALRSDGAPQASAGEDSIFSRVITRAYDNSQHVDTFIFFTASTGGYSTGESVKKALDQYRTKMDHHSARLAVVSLTTLLPVEMDSKFGDARLIGLAGFEPSLLNVLRSFVVGDLDPGMAAPGA